MNTGIGKGESRRVYGGNMPVGVVKYTREFDEDIQIPLRAPTYELLKGREMRNPIEFEQLPQSREVLYPFEELLITHSAIGLEHMKDQMDVVAVEMV